MRIARARRHFDVVAINDLSGPEQLAYSFKYDTLHGTCPGEVKIEGNSMLIGDDSLIVLGEKDPAMLPWRELEVDYVIEGTGGFRRQNELEIHLDAGARRVIVAVPGREYLENTIVLGVNDHVLTREAVIVSNASCTTNCAAPLALVLQRSFGIRHGLLNTVHAFAAEQRLSDTPHDGLRRSRRACMNIIPTSTGAGRSIGRVIPELEGKLDGRAMYVPVPDGSLVDLTVELERSVTVKQINDALHAASEGGLKGIIEYRSDPIVSSDIVGNSHSCIFDSLLTQVIDGTFVRVIAWHDNEWGYSSRVADLIGRLSAMDGI
jgi:glyceraldehyde 3-phosphate dehydrogenase